MRTLGRIVVILAAALVVAGAVWVLAGAGASAAAGMPAGAGMEQHGQQGASVLGAAEVLKNLVVVGVIIAITGLLSRLKSWRGAAAT